MKQRPRRYITDSEMAVIWDRWEKGDSINAIARDLGRYHSAVQGAMAITGMNDGQSTAAKVTSNGPTDCSTDVQVLRTSVGIPSDANRFLNWLIVMSGSAEVSFFICSYHLANARCGPAKRNFSSILK